MHAPFLCQFPSLRWVWSVAKKLFCCPTVEQRCQTNFLLGQIQLMNALKGPVGCATVCWPCSRHADLAAWRFMEVNLWVTGSQLLLINYVIKAFRSLSDCFVCGSFRWKNGDGFALSATEQFKFLLSRVCMEPFFQYRHGFHTLASFLIKYFVALSWICLTEVI